MIPHTPYERFTEEEMILRDHLAVDRTILANERTLLAYFRTALGLTAAGLSLLHFFDSPAAALFGWLLFPTGAIVAGVGFVRYRRVDRRI